MERAKKFCVPSGVIQSVMGVLRWAEKFFGIEFPATPSVVFPENAHCIRWKVNSRAKEQCAATEGACKKPQICKAAQVIVYPCTVER